ncbi:unnamed protein product [Amoebophrya sp. A25]|nr:unnamed protein product [Amoebophrya sp. A25]|eukprot:GSA25T00014193001.1
MAPSSSTSTTGVMSQHEVKANPKVPDCVMLAFERYQLGCLHEELAGPEPRQLQALDIILDICRVEPKAQEGLRQGLLDVLIHIIRNAPSPMLLSKTVEAFLLLSRFANARAKLVADLSKLERLREALQTSTEENKMRCLELVRNLTQYPRGADALVKAGFWTWLTGELSSGAKPSTLRQQIFRALYAIKIECNLDPSNTATSKSLIKLMLSNDLFLELGPGYAFSVLEFCIAVARNHDDKEEFVTNDGIPHVYKTFCDSGNLSVTAREGERIQCIAAALQFLGTLTISVTGKKQVVERLGAHAFVAFLVKVLDVESGKLERTLTQMMLEVCEHPEMRKAMRTSAQLVDKLRSSEKRADEFAKKILHKLLDNIHWEPGKLQP